MIDELPMDRGVFYHLSYHTHDRLDEVCGPNANIYYLCKVYSWPAKPMLMRSLISRKIHKIKTSHRPPRCVNVPRAAKEYLSQKNQIDLGVYFEYKIQEYVSRKI